MNKAAPALLALTLSGCVIGGDKYQRPRDLDQSWLVDRLRVLAVVAEPPEIKPGQTSSLSALVADPLGQAPSVVWLACPPEESGGFGCAVDLSTIDEDATWEELQELGVIGFEPGIAPTYTAETTLLDGLSDEQRAEGLYITVQLAAFPAEAMTDTASVDYNEVEVATKRLVVSEAVTPNHNPTIDTFLVDGYVVSDDVPVEVDHDQTYQLAIVLGSEAVETYEYTNVDGIVEERTEEPYATWYCTGGEVLEPITLFPYTQADWRAPESAGNVTCWTVVRDRRGGMTWRQQAFTIR